MTLDAIVVADSGYHTFSGTTSARLTIDGRPADVQTVINFLSHGGRVCPPVEGAGRLNWAAAPKLNGIYLASYLSQSGFTVEAIDSYCEQREAFRRLLERAPKAIFISTTFIVSKRVLHDLAADIRKLAPGVPIIAGGPFVYLSDSVLQRRLESDSFPGAGKDTLLFLDVGEEPSVDLYVASMSGEAIAREALARIIAGRSLDGLPGTLRLEGSRYVRSPGAAALIEPRTPILWQTLPDQVFAAGVVPLQASNGCPFHCAFCNFVKERRLLRVAPIDDVVDELRHIAAHGVRYVWFVDDNFRLGKRDLESFCRALIEARLDVSWMTMIRADVLETIDTSLLRDAGCIEVQLGLESADPQVLRNMNKRASPELYERVLTRLLQAGIDCTCYLIVGFPGETEESVRHTIDFMKRFEGRDFDGVVSWSLFPFIVAPLSPVDEPAMRSRFQLRGFLMEWEHATMSSAQARRHVMSAFQSISTPASVYREDNLEILRRMEPGRRRQFHATRHALAQTAARGPLEKKDIMRAFAGIFPAQASGSPLLSASSPA